jgi:membrane protein DedA with SNARE-associated domain
MGSARRAGGSILADVLWYGVGRRWGDRVPRVAAVGRARELFLALRLRALVIGKYFFAVNAAMAALAGSAGIGAAEFLVYDVTGALLWAGTWGGVGYVVQAGMTDVVAASRVWLIGAVLALYGSGTYAKRRDVPARGERQGVRPRNPTGGAAWPPSPNLGGVEPPCRRTAHPSQMQR